MQLVEVNNKSTIKSFHKLPFRIYRKNKIWIPHLKQDIEQIFNIRKNKNLKDGDAKRWILLNKKNKVIGRIAAFVNIKMKSERIAVGGMGFFECTNDKKAAFLLFDACKEWLQNYDCEAMDGPINFGEKDKFWGLLVEGFENHPVYCNTYNPSYYQSFFEQYGFKTYYNQYVFLRSVVAPLCDKYKEKAEKINLDKNFTFQHIRKTNLTKYAEDFRLVYNKAWSNSFENFKAMGEQQAIDIYKKMKPIMDEKIIWFAYYKEKPIAFSIFLPELNEIFKLINGNFNFWGKIKFWFLLKLKPPKNVHGVVFGVTPEFQGKGVEGSIMQKISKQFIDNRKYKDIILTWVGDFNSKMLHIMESLGVTNYQKLKTYRYLFNKTVKFERYPMHK